MLNIAREKNYGFGLSLMALAFFAISLLFILHPYFERRLYEIATGPAADEFNREIELGVQTLVRLNSAYGACTPETTRGLKVLLDSVRFFNSATITGKSGARCSVISSLKRNVVAPEISWDVYSLGVNEAEVVKAMGLPYWFALSYRNMFDDVAKRFWEIDRKALISAVNDVRVYVIFNTNLAFFLWLFVWVFPVLCLVVMCVKVRHDAGNDKAQAQLIKQLLENNKIDLQYQPIVNLENGNWVGAEALLRCINDTADTYYAPPYIVELAESHDCSRELFRVICTRVANDYNQYFWAIESFYITINITSANLSQPDCVLQIEEIFNEFNIPSSVIAFEVTERTLVCDQTAIDNLFQLKNLGFKIALDDFGTGYCGLQYLEQFPVDVIKLDASFIKFGRSSMIAYAACLAKLKEITVIAEGVETIGQRHELLKEGILLGQGWFYSAATTPSKFVRKYFTLHQREVVYSPL